MRVNMTIEYSDVAKRLEASIERVLRGTKKATIKACQDILAASKPQVPVDSGDLVGSAYYEIQGSYRQFTGTVGYAKSGPAMDYAVIQHETLWYNHPNGGKAKFLEDPLRAYVTNYSSRAAMTINGELQGR